MGEEDDEALIKVLLDELLVAVCGNVSSSRSRAKVRFKQVDMYLFERTQGFGSIPSDGSSNSITLGMAAKHSQLKTFDDQDEYLRFKRIAHLEKLEEEKIKITNSLTKPNKDMVEYEEADVKKILNIVSKREEYEDIEVDLPINMDLFCPILSPAERRAKLIEAGLIEDQIDPTESNEILEILESREHTGCICSKYGLDCGPENEFCSCYVNGIGCQIDKPRYPCHCTAKKCKNPNGLKRFNQKAVLLHCQQILKQNLNELQLPVEIEKSLKSKPVKRKRKRANYSQPKKRKVK